MKTKLVLIDIPEIEQSGIYAINTVAGIEIVFDVKIEREYKTYQHDYDTPPEELLSYEFLECNILSAHDADGNRYEIPKEIEYELENKIMNLIKQTR